MNTFKDQLVGLRHKQQLMYVLVFSLVTIVVWIGLSIFASQKSSEISPELKLLAKPLNPNIDETALRKLESKIQYTQSELNQFTIFKIIKSKDGKVKRLVTIDTSAEDVFTTPSPSPKPNLENEPTATQSSQLNSPQATSSGDIIPVP